MGTSLLNERKEMNSRHAGVGAVHGDARSSSCRLTHMFWGGLLMLLAVMLLLGFLDRSVENLAAVIAGLGFGTLIDSGQKPVATSRRSSCVSPHEGARGSIPLNVLEEQ
jgi:hypothetical protein